MEKAKPQDEFEEAIGRDLAKRLVESGLFEKEARAMVNTWRTSYFQQDGIRVLYVLPQLWTEAFIPMQLEPKPTELVRVMVGRTELLTPEREAKAEAAVRDLSSSSSSERERAFMFLREQGRYAEPILRRVMRTTADDRVRILCARLLLTGFVTDLRTATVAPEDGAPVIEKPAFVRAQLAALLHEIGLNAEAKEEGVRVLSLIDSMQQPTIEHPVFRKFVRARARAHEAMGDVKGAMASYASFIRFGSQSRKCGGCHAEEGPKNMAFYRDWWAGRKYAQYVSEAGLLDRTIREHEETLKEKPRDVATGMMLAYLYQYKGDQPKATEAFAVAGIPAQGRSLASSIDEEGNSRDALNGRVAGEGGARFGRSSAKDGKQPEDVPRGRQR